MAIHGNGKFLEDWDVGADGHDDVDVDGCEILKRSICSWIACGNIESGSLRIPLFQGC